MSGNAQLAVDKRSEETLSGDDVVLGKVMVEAGTRFKEESGVEAELVL